MKITHDVEDIFGDKHPYTHDVDVWADGFGLWHARTLHGSIVSRPRDAARLAIRAALAEREGPNFAPQSVEVALAGGGNGWVYYVEVPA